MAAPFGMLVSKWLIIEVAANQIWISVILAIGSADSTLLHQMDRKSFIGNVF